MENSSRILDALVKFLHRALTALIVLKEDGQYFDYWQWKWIDWKEFGSPWQVSSSEAEIYRKAVHSKDIKQPAVLILGATPALRILAAEIGARVVCADFSLPMLAKMGNAVEKEQPDAVEREIWFKGDWLVTPFPENYFDFVLGDLVLLFVSRENREIFLGNIRRALKNGGYFITRTHVVDETAAVHPYSKYLDAFFSSKCAALKRLDDILCFLKIKLLDISWGENSGKTNRAAMTAGIQKYISGCTEKEKQKILHLFLKNYAEGIDFHYENKLATESSFKKFFKIAQIHTANDYAISGLAEFYPTYVLEK